MNNFHQPVMVEEAAEFLIFRPNMKLADLTCGGGNHLKRFSEKLDNSSTLIGIDRDPEAIAESKQVLHDLEHKTYICEASYQNFDQVLNELKIAKVDGFFIDSGISSYQINNPQRGFSFMQDGPLDMRMGSDSEFSAEEVVNTFSRQQLIDIFRDYGEERRAVSAASAIIREREKRPLQSTAALVEILQPVLAGKHLNASLARIFQSLRIFVNQELSQLKNTLPRLLEYLNIGGRIVVLSYHSLEDRLVKQFFRNEAKGCICPPKLPVCACGLVPRLKILTRKTVKPSASEIEENSRSRSARLRAAEMIA